MTTLPPALVEGLPGIRRLVVLTGAGMSAESGVPVFRGPGGLWEGFRPEDLATPEAFARDPERVWRWYRWRLDAVEAAEPHAGHRALAELEASRSLEAFRIVTQNVDRLHQRAGSTAVTELHGTLVQARCSAGCGRTRPSREVDPRSCECDCGAGRLRPEVVWFGESLGPGCLTTALRAVESAEMVWVVGTSSVVYPAAALTGVAPSGVTVVEVNPEATPQSSRAAHVLRVPASEGLAALVAGLGGGR